MAEAAPITAETDVGAPAVVAGVAASDSVEYEPVPATLTAATWNTYDVPFVRPVTVAEVKVDVPSANVDHVEPQLDEH